MSSLFRFFSLETLNSLLVQNQNGMFGKLTTVLKAASATFSFQGG